MKNSIARVTPKRLRRKPKRVDCFTCRDGKRYAWQQAKKQRSLIFSQPRRATDNKNLCVKV